MDEATSVSLFAAFEPLIREVIFGVLTLVLMGALELARRHLGLKVSQENKQVILAASQRAATAILSRYGPALRDLTTPDSPAVQEAARYVQDQLPKRLKQMGMDGAAVQRLILAEIESRLGTDIPEPRAMTEQEILHEMKDLYDKLVELKAPKGV